MTISALKAVKILQERGIKAYGNLDYRGRCPVEDADLMTFVAYLRMKHPALGALVIHPPNEGLAYGGQFRKVATQQKKGQTKGAADIIIPIAPPFVCELKRKDPTKSTFTQEQIDYLIAAHSLGAFACVAFGYDGADRALEAFRRNLSIP